MSCSHESKWRERGWTTSQRGAGLSQLETGLKIWEQTEPGWDTAMGWRNVTHAINELPVCLPKWWLRENALGHRHLGQTTNPCPLPPPLSASPPRWAQSGWEEELSPEASLAPSHSPISSDTHSRAINKLEACPLRSARALQSSSRHRDYRLIPHHSTVAEVRADMRYCQQSLSSKESSLQCSDRYHMGRPRFNWKTIIRISAL